MILSDIRQILNYIESNSSTPRTTHGLTSGKFIFPQGAYNGYSTWNSISGISVMAKCMYSTRFKLININYDS